MVILDCTVIYTKALVINVRTDVNSPVVGMRDKYIIRNQVIWNPTTVDENRSTFVLRRLQNKIVNHRRRIPVND